MLCVYGLCKFGVFFVVLDGRVYVVGDGGGIIIWCEFCYCGGVCG